MATASAPNRSNPTLGSVAANDDELSDDQLDRVAAGSGFDGRALLDLLKGLDE